MGVLDRILKKTCCDKTGRMSHIDHEDSSDLIGELTDTGIVPVAAICRSTGYNKFWTLCASLFLHLLVVHTSILNLYGVGNRLEVKTGEINGGTVGEVAAMGKVHTHELIAGLQTGHENSHVCLGAAVRLDIGPFCAEKLLGALDSDILCLIYFLTSAIVTLGRVSFGIFIGQAGTHSSHDLVGYEVLTGDQLYAATLAKMFAVNDLEDFVVSFHRVVLILG